MSSKLVKLPKANLDEINHFVDLVFHTEVPKQEEKFESLEGLLAGTVLEDLTLADIKEARQKFISEID